MPATTTDRGEEEPLRRQAPTEESPDERKPRRRKTMTNAALGMNQAVFAVVLCGAVLAPVASTMSIRKIRIKPSECGVIPLS
jgi:hypothetical protein